MRTFFLRVADPWKRIPVRGPNESGPTSKVLSKGSFMIGIYPSQPVFSVCSCILFPICFPESFDRLFLYSNRIIFETNLWTAYFGCGKPDSRRNRKDTGSGKVYQELLAKGKRCDPEPWLQKQGRTQTFFGPDFGKRQIPPKIVSDGERPAGFRRGGRRTFHVGHQSPRAIVLADKDRVKAGRFAIDNFQADALILDDGFQYLPLKGTLNLLLVDQTNPSGTDVFPRGILGTSKHLSRASYSF